MDKKFMVTRTEEVRKTHDGRKWKDISETLKAYGQEFRRSGYEINDEVSDNITSEHFRSDGEIGVLCGKCHHTLFSLRYGGYEISAKCAKCGMDSVVYDG